jgi:7-cyano-7-deazaguanine reductase
MGVTKPQLGAVTEYPASYAPELLVSIPRQQSREKLPIAWRYSGIDIWTAYELSWLDSGGKPRVAIAEFRVRSDSEAIVESKSFKLYLNSFNQEKISSVSQLQTILQTDLSAAFGGEVAIEIYSLGEYADLGVTDFSGICLDQLDVSCDQYEPDAGLLKTASGRVDQQTLYSHLLKSNCPVTGQPDWASVAITYTGQALDQAALLKYLVSFRNHQDFHENCVERIFSDIMNVAKHEFLQVYARYTRRGGLDINPLRTTGGPFPDRLRLPRQ